MLSVLFFRGRALKMESVRFTGRVRAHFGRFDHVKPAKTDRWTSLKDEITSRCDEKVKSKQEILAELTKIRQASTDILGPDAKHEDRHKLKIVFNKCTIVR